MKKNKKRAVEQNTLTKVLVWLAFGSLILAPFSLFYVDSNLLFPYVTGKAYLWRFLVLTLFTAWASLTLLDPRFRINFKHPLFIAVTAFVGVMGLATLFSVDPYRAFWSNAERMDGFISLLFLWVYFVSFIGLIKEKSHARMALGVLLLLGFVLGLIGLPQETDRIYSTLGNPIYLGSVSLLCIFISLYFFGREEKFIDLDTKFRKIFFALLSFFFLWVLFETQTRGALLGLAFGGFASALIVAICAKTEDLKIWRGLSFAYVGLFIIVGGLFIFVKDQVADNPIISAIPIVDRAFDVSFDDNTTVHRLENWSMAIDGFKERPLLGWGQESYIDVFSKYFSPDELWDAEQWFDRTHNVYLDWLVFGGIFGLVAFLSIFIVALWLIFRNKDLDVLPKAALVGLVVAYLAQNIVAFDSLASGIFIYSVIAFVFVLSNNRSVQRGNIPLPAAFSALVLVWVGFVLAVIYVVCIPRDANKNFLSILAGDLPGKERVENLQKSFDLNTSYSQEIFEQTSNRLPSIIANPAYSESEKLEIIEIVRQEGLRLLEQDSNDTRLNLFYGAFLLRIQENEAAVPYLAKAVELSPQKPSILLAYGQALYLAGDEQYREVFQFVKELVPQDETVVEAVDQYLAL